ncbi:hypothetical protein [Agarivorans sp. Alg241-V36]|uniref:hypothetical protein n=1 Tax=Agarivorans sp. Alg241-V36 TaxID=2305992 RepID=UPI0013D6D513|nr:hypothetical protein [Agarivorans sp. Alg241-V36]
MNKALLPSLVAAVMLSGCGGSDSSPSTPSAPKYNWQIIQLHTVKESDLKSGCIVYGTAEIDPSRVITASVANAGYNILFHNADGSIIEEHTIPAIDVPSSGIVSIDSSLVPEDGYVSLEEVDGNLSGNPDVYMFGVEKELLSHKVLNVRSTQTGSECYKGIDYRSISDTADSAALTVLQESGVSYYQTSYSADAVSGRDIASHIPVISPLPAARDTLVTAFYTSNNDQHTDLAYYGFIEPSYVYDSEDYDEITPGELNNQDLMPMYWQSAANLDLDEGSAILAIHNNQSYQWQTLYHDVDQFTIAANYSEVSHWLGLFSGVSNDSSWQFESVMAIDDQDSGLELSLPDLAPITGVDIQQQCPTALDNAKYCIDNAGSFSEDDFALQRSHVKVLTNNNRAFYQSIYAQAKAQQPLLESSAIELSIQEIEGLELALIEGELASTQQDYFMAKYLDTRSIAETGQVSAFSDANGFIITPDDYQDLYLDMLKSSTTVVQQAK